MTFYQRSGKDDVGTPAGSDGEIQFNSSGSFGASGHLYWDGVSGRLGVGTSSPFYAVDVNGDINMASGTGQNATLQTLRIGANQFAKMDAFHKSLYIGKDAGVSIDNSGATTLQNLFIGDSAGSLCTTGSQNAFIGTDSGRTCTTGSSNFGLGKDALESVSTGNSNVAIGAESGTRLTSSDNVCIGHFAGRSFTTGGGNVAIGRQALSDAAASTCHSNTMVGTYSALNITTGYDNVFIGNRAGLNATTGHTNLIVGRSAAGNLTTGSNNIVIGNYADPLSATGDVQLNIGDTIYGEGMGAAVDKKVFIRAGSSQSSNLFEVQDSAGTTLSHIDDDGNFIVSSGKYFGKNSNSNFTPDSSGNYYLNSEGAINLNIDTNNNETNRFVAVRANGANSAGTILLRIYENGDAYFEVGNVGIGTTSPTGKLDVNDDVIRVRTSKTPSSASDTGNQGEIAWDSSYIYICTSTDTWKRAALSTW